MDGYSGHWMFSHAKSKVPKAWGEKAVPGNTLAEDRTCCHIVPKPRGNWRPIDRRRAGAGAAACTECLPRQSFPPGNRLSARFSCCDSAHKHSKF